MARLQGFLDHPDAHPPDVTVQDRRVVGHGQPRREGVVGVVPGNHVHDYAQSATVRVNGPAVSWDHTAGITPYILTRPQDGRSPTQLLWAAGRRIELPVSSPKAPAHRAAAVALPEPVLDPPASCSTFQGLQGCP